MVVRPTKARDAQQQPLKDPPAELHDRRERGGARSRRPPKLAGKNGREGARTRTVLLRADSSRDRTATNDFGVWELGPQVTH